MAQRVKKKPAETDLYAPLVAYLTAQGYTVRGEVRHCDIAAVKGDALLVIEMKLALNLALVVQGVRRQQMTDSVYLAVPRPPNCARWMRQMRGAFRVLRRLELGLILVSLKPGKPPVEIVFHPLPSERRKRGSDRRAVLEEVGGRSEDFNLGGSMRQPLVTAYRENAIQIACYLADAGELQPRDRIAIFTLGCELRVLHTFSNDTGELVRLRRYRWSFATCRTKRRRSVLGRSISLSLLGRPYLDTLRPIGNSRACPLGPNTLYWYARPLPPSATSATSSGVERAVVGMLVVKVVSGFDLRFSIREDLLKAVDNFFELLARENIAEIGSNINRVAGFRGESARMAYILARNKGRFLFILTEACRQNTVVIR